MITSGRGRFGQLYWTIRGIGSVMRDIKRNKPTPPEATEVAAQKSVKRPAQQPAVKSASRQRSWVQSHATLVVVLAVVILAVIGAAIWWTATRPSTDEKPASAVAAEFEKRLPELAQAAKDKKGDAAARKEYAVALYATGDYKAAKDQYEAAVKINGKDATAYNNLGNTYRDLKNPAKAVESYKKSLSLNDKSINTYNNLANVQLYTLDKADDAIATYRSGLKALPNNEQLELLLGLAYEKNDDKVAAKQTYKNILSRNDKNAAAKANLERLEK